jgi:hypothetical protein
MAQVIKLFPSKCEVLSSNSSTPPHTHTHTHTHRHTHAHTCTHTHTHTHTDVRNKSLRLRWSREALLEKRLGKRVDCAFSR